MQEYVLKTQHAAHNALDGISIHETPESNYLKQLFQQAYEPRTLQFSFSRLMRAERKRAEKQHRLDGVKHHAASMVYYASALHFFGSNLNSPPHHDAFFLLGRLDTIGPVLRRQIVGLYEQRKADRSKFGFDLSPFVPEPESMRGQADDRGT